MMVMEDNDYRPSDSNPFRSLYEQMSPIFYNRGKITEIVKRYDEGISEGDYKTVMEKEIMPLLREAEGWHNHWD